MSTTPNSLPELPEPQADSQEFAYTADQMRDYALAALSQRPDTAGWQPIESAPRDGTEILIGWYGQECSGSAVWRDGSENYWEEAGFYFSDDDRLTGHASHPDCWLAMPFPPSAAPQPPKEAI